MAAADQVDQAQIEAGKLAQHQRVADVLRRVHDHRRAGSIPNGLIEPVGKLRVLARGGCQLGAAAQPSERRDIAVPVDDRAQPDRLVDIELVPAAKADLADLSPERALAKARAAAAAVVALQAAMPDEFSLAD